MLVNGPYSNRTCVQNRLEWLKVLDIGRKVAPAQARSTWEPPTIASVPSSPKTIQALLPPS